MRKRAGQRGTEYSPITWYHPIYCGFHRHPAPTATSPHRRKIRNLPTLHFLYQIAKLPPQSRYTSTTHPLTPPLTPAPHSRRALRPGFSIFPFPKRICLLPLLLLLPLPLPLPLPLLFLLAFPKGICFFFCRCCCRCLCRCLCFCPCLCFFGCHSRRESAFCLCLCFSGWPSRRESAVLFSLHPSHPATNGSGHRANAQPLHAMPTNGSGHRANAQPLHAMAQPLHAMPRRLQSLQRLL